MKFVRYLSLLLLIFTGSFSHAANNYQDWWWNPAQSGMGLNVGQQNESIFVAWFNYGDDTKASFLTMGGVLNGNTLTGPLFRNTGPVPGPNYNPALVKQIAVGTATLTFNSNTDATLTYSYDNKGGTMALQRFSFANPNLNQNWTVLNTSTTKGCTNATMNGTTTKIQNIKGQLGAGNNFTFIVNDLDGSSLCIASMTLQAAGSRGAAVGTATCEGGASANMAFGDISIQADYLNFSFTASGNSTDKSCVQTGNMSGVLKKDAPPTYDIKTAFQNRIIKGASKTFNVTGDCKGTFSQTDSPAAKTIWNNQTVYAVGNTNIPSIPNCSLGFSSTQTSITYYDLDFVDLAKFHSDGSYSEFVKSPRPNSVTVGDSGTLGTWTHWNNTGKTNLYERDVMSYVIEPNTSSSVIVNLIDRTYDSNNQLEITSQLRFRLDSTGTLDWYSVTIDFANNKGHLFLQ